MTESRATFPDHFSRGAAGYAAHRPTYPPALLAFLAGLVRRRECAWDVGCGTGQLSVLLAEAFERVVATDASQAQVDHATAHPRVEYRCAPAEESGIPAASVDLVVAAQAAHWFDLERWYREIARVARVEAAIALVTYGIMTVDAEIDPVIRNFYFATLAGHWPPERRHVEDGYRSLAFPFDEVSAPPCEIVVSWHLADLVGYVHTWSALRSLEKERGRAPLDEFERALGLVWGPPDRARAVRWPLAVRAGTIRTR